jgi:glutamate-1-semialdehyde 2,1-aminomutase
MSDTHVTPSTARWAELYDLAAGSIAGGVGSGTRSHRSRYPPVPVFVRSGQGAHITDEDGNDFVEYVMGQGPLSGRHRPDAVGRPAALRPMGHTGDVALEVAVARQTPSKRSAMPRRVVI